MAVDDGYSTGHGVGGTAVPPRKAWYKGRPAVVAGVVVLVLAVGIGAFAIVHTVNSATTTSAPTSPSPSPTTLPPANRSAGVAPGSFETGTVKSVGSAKTSFVVTTCTATTVTVDVTSSTKYVDSSVKSPSFADVKVGQRVVATGSTASNGVFDAKQVTIGVARGGFRGGTGTGSGRGGFFGGGTPPAAFGTVQSVNSSAHTFTVASRTGGTVTVVTSSTTTYHAFGGSSASFSSITANVRVLVDGSTSSSGTITATSVTVLPTGSGGGFGGFGGGTGGTGGSAGSTS